MKHVASLTFGVISAAALALSPMGSVVSAQEDAAQSVVPNKTFQKKKESQSAPGTGLYDSAAPHGWDSFSNRLELRFPDLARKYGSDPRFWPPAAFRGIDCDLPSSGCPTTESDGGGG